MAAKQVKMQRRDMKENIKKRKELFLDKDKFDAALVNGLRGKLLRNYAMLAAASNNRNLKFLNEDFNIKNKYRKARNCPCCGESSERSDLIYSGFGMNISSCNACELVYSTVILKDEADREIYSAEVVDAYLDLKQHAVYGELERQKALYIISSALEVRPEIEVHLDIGSGAGRLLEAGAYLGLTSTGIEPNPRFFRFTKNMGLDVVGGFFPEALRSRQARSFDLITSCDVLEHIDDVGDFLRGVKAMLSQGGLFAIQVPNFDSLLLRLEGESNVNNICLGHWNYFTSRSLEGCLAQAGFRAVKTETYISEFDKIKNFSEAEIEARIREITGGDLAPVKKLSIDSLHNKKMGFKLFGLFEIAE